MALHMPPEKLFQHIVSHRVDVHLNPPHIYPFFFKAYLNIPDQLLVFLDAPYSDLSCQ